MLRSIIKILVKIWQVAALPTTALVVALSLAGMSLGLSTSRAYAAVTLEALPDTASYNDFVVGPGKIEAELSPGETATFELTVANRLGSDRTFAFHEQDFQGTQNAFETVKLLGDDRGPYSLKDYLHIASTTVDIPQGMRARVSVTISIPADAQPGGLYGSVVIGTATKNGEPTPVSGAQTTSPIITQIGTLFFVRVKGTVNEDGQLAGFTIAGGKHVLGSSATPIVFDLTFKNDGNVHLDPYGTVDITNLLGATVGTIQVEPWFAMPNSLRFREISWNAPFLFGRYVAHASIHRGYGSAVDEATTTFWVIPWKIILVLLVVLAIVIFGIRFIFTRFQFRIVSKSDKATTKVEKMSGSSSSHDSLPTIN